MLVGLDVQLVWDGEPLLFCRMPSPLHALSTQHHSSQLRRTMARRAHRAGGAAGGERRHGS